MLIIKLVSVVIANYNNNDYLEEAIMSIIEQDYNNIEIIVIDDGSTDLSPYTIKSLSSRDSRIIYRICERMGKIKAYNYGVSLAKGCYIKLFSSDDVLHKNALTKLVTEISNYDVVCHNTTITDESLNIIKEKLFNFSSHKRSFIVSDVLNGASFPSGCYLFKREVLSMIYPIPEDASYEDWYIFMNLIKNGHRICFMNESLAYYRQHCNNTYGGVFNLDKSVFLYRLERNVIMLDVFKRELPESYHHALECKKREFELIMNGDLLSIMFFPSSFKIRLKIFLKRYFFFLWLLLSGRGFQRAIAHYGSLGRSSNLKS